MDFTLNDEQRLIQESVQKFVQGSYDFEKRRRKVKEISPVDAGVWSQFAELGWLALPFDEADGGFGGTVVETMVLMEEFGKGLVVEPYIPTVVLGGGFLRRASAAQKQKYLPALIEGKLQMAFAVEEYGRVFALENTALRAEADGDGFVLNGSKSVVLNGDNADVLVVLARTAGEPGDGDGLSLLLVETGSDGVSRRAHRTVDGQQAAEIAFDKVRVSGDALLGERGNALPLAQTVVNEAILAMGAEAVGALSVLQNTTVEYSRTRKQFGVPIGKFQALQHRMVDMFIACEQGRSLMLAATLKTLEGHEDAERAVHALKGYLGRGGRKVAQEAIQLHGGIGMTDELSIGHYFKRLTAIDALFGNADQHLREMAAG